MKSKIFRLSFLTALFSAVLFLNIAQACDWCNNAFFLELNTSRSGSLVSDELLAAIQGQKDLATWESGTSVRSAEAMAAATAREAAAPSSPVATEATPAAVVPPAPAATPAASPASAEAAAVPDNFIDIIQRDAGLSIPPTSYVSQDTEPDKRVRITLSEGEVYLGNGVMYNGFVIDGSIPGPTIVVTEGDIVEFTVVNEGNIQHGASIHAAYTQTSKYLGAIAPQDSATVVFRASHPGVYMYHCAPGGHAIPMHIIYGQYGMMVVEPKDQKFKLEEELGREPDVEIYLTQHEYYASGKDAVTGQGQPMYTAFNGKLFRYVEEPIMARPGDYVRINFLNVGPNLVSTFHLVGIIWDYAYWQGHPENVFVGGQSVIAGPADSWVVEFRVPPDEGAYLMLSHAVGSTDRGAIGILMADADAETPVRVDSQGPQLSAEELAEVKERSARTISPFAPGTPDVDVPVRYGEETEEVIVRIIGNSFYPKVLDIKPGTKVTWINEDVFTYMQGEFSGIHNAVAIGGPDLFASPLLAHAESFSHTFEEVGEYTYICTPHPYMKGIVTVSEIEGRGLLAGMGGWLSLLALLVAGVTLAFVYTARKENNKPAVGSAQ